MLAGRTLVLQKAVEVHFQSVIPCRLSMELHFMVCKYTSSPGSTTLAVIRSREPSHADTAGSSCGASHRIVVSPAGSFPCAGKGGSSLRSLILCKSCVVLGECCLVLCRCNLILSRCSLTLCCWNLILGSCLLLLGMCCLVLGRRSLLLYCLCTDLWHVQVGFIPTCRATIEATDFLLWSLSCIDAT